MDRVRVAVNIRPLITSELLAGCTDCISVASGEPQVQIGTHTFTYDHVYGSTALPSSSLYDDCVAPLVDALFHGYNATVLAYGQTGSGKTYMMGTDYSGEGSTGGIIPKVMEAIFERVETTKDNTEFSIRVSFIEIFKEEVFDLLDLNSSSLSKNEATAPAKHVARVPIQIRETVSGGITLAGVTEAEVRTKEEMGSYLARGSLSRATGSTNMNSQSSRSHAIFTITMEQISSSKLHLVDLASSERTKRTGSEGDQLKEGIHINKGLLALGNVISALGDERKMKEGGHVPYRNSKLTRFLQDSLGGNSKTVMIACVSPADANAEDTLNTLKYANRARNIQNKAVINRDPVAAQLQLMRSQIELLQTEFLLYRGHASAPYEELQILKHKVSLLEASNMELRQELQGLVGELLCLKNSQRRRLVDCVESDDDGFFSKNILFPPINEYSSDYDTKAGDVSDVIEDVEKEQEHSSLQEKLDRELRELDKALEQKEAEMKRFTSSDTSVLKLYEKKVQELEHEKKALQREIVELRHNLSNISSTSGDGAQKLKEDYLHKLNVLEGQVFELKKKQDAQAQLLRQKQKSNEAARRLEDEIQRIKAQKVPLQHKIKHESERFRLWKASREKEVLQVLQRKTEETHTATKWLKELLESRKTSSRETSGHNAPGIQALMQTNELDLEVAVKTHEIRSEYERQMEDDSLEITSPGARNSPIFALENMLATSSSTMVSMASKLSETEERERGFNGMGRWNQVWSLPEAKTLMNHMNHVFNLASSSRCLLGDKEVAYREKDLEIRDLKEKVVSLNSLLRKSKVQKDELMHQVKSQNSALKKYAENGHKYEYELHKLFILEDVDTSDSDDEWRASRKPKTKRRKSKGFSAPGTSDSGGSRCSCSRRSSCKTITCQCRSTAGACGPSCGCVPAKCSNRESSLLEVHGSPEVEIADGIGNDESTDETEKNQLLASQGARLLQNALVERPSETTDDGGPRRKALSEIGNTLVKSNAPKPNQRKKWRRTTIQLVTNAPPPSQPETAEAPQRPHKGAPEADIPMKLPHKGVPEADIPMKLPRAMRSAASNGGNPFRERNSDKADQSGVNKEGGVPAPRSPLRQNKTSDEKENCGL